jgi:hypothetical protein
MIDEPITRARLPGPGSICDVIIQRCIACNFTDCHIKLYDTSSDKLREFQDVLAQNVGWSIVDTAYR